MVYLMLEGYQTVWFGDPETLENVERRSACGIPPQKACAAGTV